MPAMLFQQKKHMKSTLNQSVRRVGVLLPQTLTLFLALHHVSVQQCDIR
jgi:hypothetical protein